jgi:hypothetical protein
MRPANAGIFGFALLAACAIPTDSPNWDTTWNLPVPDKGALNIPVSAFLPAGVSLGTPPTAFSANVGNPPPISRTLGADCTSCVNGTNQAKPAFTSAPPATSTTFAAGASLTSAALAVGSQIVFSINNGFNFDPIRPQAGSATTNTGTLTLTVSNGATNLGVLALPGTQAAIPASSISTFTLPLSGTISGSQPITVTMTLTSPAGSVVAINTAQVFTVSGTPTIKISSANVSIAAQAINVAGSPIDLSGLDSSIISRVADSTSKQGTMFLTITNPFTVGGSVNIIFKSAAGTPAIAPISKVMTLAAATNGTTPKVSTVAIDFTGQELRTILGRNLDVTFTGNTAAGALTVTPTQKIGMTSRLEFTLMLKGQ